jgi:rhodanese-related sulfurtransferase
VAASATDRRFEIAELRRRIENHSAPVVLDVRSAAEFRAGRVPGAVNLPFWQTLIGVTPFHVARDQPLVVYCGHGPRARVSAAMLRLRGFRHVACLVGHMAEWRRRGLPQEHG